MVLYSAYLCHLDPLVIIGLSGYAQSGKDSVAKILVEEYGYTRIAFADKIKELLYEINPRINDRQLQQWVDTQGWDATKEISEVRMLLQNLGVGGRKIIGNKLWIKVAMMQYEPMKHFVFTDVRFTNEAEMIKDYGGHIWRVERPGINPVNDHVSESELNVWNFDEMIYNAGTLKDLTEIVRSSMEFDHDLH